LFGYIDLRCRICYFHIVREIAERTPADVAMERYAAGDDSAFGDVYDAVAPRVFAYLRRQTRDLARAEDLVQQTLLSMHRARGTFISGSAVLPWAFAIARRLFIDELRRDRRSVLTLAEIVSDDSTHASSDDSADGLAEARELAALLQRELVRLPEAQRVAFELMRLDGLSHIEAAEVLGATVTAVKLRAHRAYVALRVVLGDRISDPNDAASETRR
jgi:RNA polymerase sigma-70 factor (ECF subfamily)